MKARIPGGMNGGQANMMKKIQEMQAQLEQKQAEVENSEFTASAGVPKFRLLRRLTSINAITPRLRAMISISPRPRRRLRSSMA